MTDKQILRQFIKFLKFNNVYNEYLINLKKGLDYRLKYSKVKTKNDAEWIAQMIKFEPNRLTIDAFSWLTKDKYCWSNLHRMWEEWIIYAIKKKNKL